MLPTRSTESHGMMGLWGKEEREDHGGGVCMCVCGGLARGEARWEERG